MSFEPWLNKVLIKATVRRNGRTMFSLGGSKQLWGTDHFEACLSRHNIWQSCLHLDPVIVDAGHLVIILNRLRITNFEQDLFVW